MKDKNKIKRQRIWEIDFFRGFAILLVILDHTMVDFSMFSYDWLLSGVSWLTKMGETGDAYLASYLRLFWRPVFLFIFFFTSGISTAFSRNNFLRGLRLAGLSVGISLFTYFFSNISGADLFILFGVLHCFAAIILIYSILTFIVDLLVKLFCLIAKKNYTEKVSKIVLAIICLILGIVFYMINQKYNISLYETDPFKMYIKTDSKWLGMLFYARNWATADYFPLFPFISFFFLGAGLTQFLYPKKKSLFPSIDGKWHLPVTFAGRYSLIIYLSMQIIIIAILALITYIATGIFLFA